ncbi:MULTISPECIES: hypothetical protein [unclassified Vibrio]|uniref:hypothetical protein n=1 Tax=unclassified Vibrio TaxID=2614977 RepID=UPI0019298EB4|nr:MULTISPECIES: hypothetical protein [unclassified Vibrio]
MIYGVQLTNPYSLDETIEKIRFVLTETQRLCALELFEKAVSKSLEDRDYYQATEETLLRGSTIALREWLSCFGDYLAPPRSEFPPYPYKDAVNGIDSALHIIKFDAVVPNALQEHIDFVKLMKS